MLPAREATATLEYAARSCLAQTVGDLELLFLANQTAPETRAIMERLATEDSRVRILEAPDFIPALNLGWEQARGQFLARMDADDFSYPNRIEQQIGLLQANREIGACGSLVRILRRDLNGEVHSPLQGYADFESWLNSVISPDEIAKERFVDSPIANPCAMIRRDVFDKIGGYREVSWAEDYDFWLRLLDSGLKIGKVDEVLLDWFDSETRLTRNDEHYAQDQFLEAKAHYLAKLAPVKTKGVVVLGAGPIGKRLVRLLQQESVAVHAFLEVSDKRIGNQIAGVPVLGSEALPFPNKPVMISAVGLPGARDRIRHLLTPHDYFEGRNFFCAA